jgi:hypothetical protein
MLVVRRRLEVNSPRNDAASGECDEEDPAMEIRYNKMVSGFNNEPSVDREWGLDGDVSEVSWFVVFPRDFLVRHGQHYTKKGEHQR